MKQELLLGFPFSSEQLPRVRELLEQSLTHKTFDHIDHITLTAARSCLKARVEFLEEHKLELFEGLSEVWKEWIPGDFTLVPELLRLLVGVEVAVSSKDYFRKHYYDIELAMGTHRMR